ncbi:Polycomb protein eed [Metarhizium brunneum]|uniref:Polycomb protein eed n=1 Tax=Metarhizium brunneum TaxID=500148 RepID=A0A7D5YQQ0_9HYPO|nr:Polycomb protein eed [Metarhizium brunneum]
MAATDGSVFELPKLRVSIGFENDTRFLGHDDNVAEFFDIKFCPYQPLDCDPVFAAVSKKHIVICKLSPSTGESNPCAIINIIRDDDDEASGCCCTWTKDPVSGTPYICVGGVDAKVKIYDVSDGSLVECFVGHGGDVNDLATSPIESSIIASASDDTSVRIWSLDPIHKEQPCLCILAGEGHSWNLLSLWTIPDLPMDAITTPLQVHYPHFSTSAVHSGIVDCVAFYGDCVLSRACHDNVIVLWRIEGFSSEGLPPPQSAAPTPQNVVPTSYEDPDRLTRSAFVPATSPQCPSQYTRLLEFHTPNCGPQFFMRFKLFHVPDQNPVLAFCNAAGNIFFWDFRRLTVYHEVMAGLQGKSKAAVTPSWLKPFTPRQRADAMGRFKGVGSDRDSLASGQTGQTEASEYSPETLESWASRYSTEDPHEPLRAHKTESSSTNFVGRQAAWSPGGEWCVVVGSSNTMLILQRWAKGAPCSRSTG